MNVIHTGDSKEILKTLKEKSIDVCVTSPPYWKQRDYHNEDQLGQEKTVQDYIKNLLTIFEEVKRVLKPWGSLFVVMGDSYNQKNKCINQIPQRFSIAMTDVGGWVLRTPIIIWYKNNALPLPLDDRWGVNYEPVFHFTNSSNPLFYVNEQRHTVSYVKPKKEKWELDLDYYWKEIYVPHEERELFVKKIANNPLYKYDFEGIDATWHIWKKFSYWKGYDYFFNKQYEPLAESTLKEIFEEYKGISTKDYDKEGVNGGSDVKRRIIAGKRLPKFGGAQKFDGYDDAVYSGKEWVPNMHGRIARAVWEVNTENFKGEHFATYPVKLVDKCLDATAPELNCSWCTLPSWHGNYCECKHPFIRPMVLDPFMGTGTTGIACKFRALDFTGIDTNEDYCRMAIKRIEDRITCENFF